LLEYWKPEEIRVLWLTLTDEVIKQRSIYRDKTLHDKRPDDRLDVVDDRIDYYHKTSKDITDRLISRGIISHMIDGDQPINDVHTAIRKALA
jgi:adenylate kinase family enzyme